MPNIDSALRDFTRRREAVVLRLIQMCKHLEPQLRDLNANNSADRLAAVLGELDVIEEEVVAVLKDNPEGFMDALLRGIERNR